MISVRRGDACVEDVEDALVEGDRPIVPGTARAALRHRTFRTVFVGAFLSNIGSWMQNVVLAAYAYELTGSATYVGLLNLAQLGPLLALSMVGGLIADWFDRRALLVWISLEQLAFSIGLAVLCRSADPSRAGILLMVLAIGLGQSVFAPTYSALLPGLVGKRDMPGAISLNSAQMNGSRVIGPIIGAFVFHQWGPSWVFLLNAGTYLFVIGALFVVVLPPAAPGAEPTRRSWKTLFSGITVARADRVVGRALVTVFLFSFFCLVWVGQLSVVAAQNFGISPRSSAYGLLYAVFGCGALAGALSIGSFLSGVAWARLVRVALVGYAAVLCCFALVSSRGLAYPVIFVLGCFYFAFITALSTAMQSRLDESVRGRVMALWLMGFGGTVGFGNLFYGPIIDRVGVTPTLLVGVGVALALARFCDLRVPDEDGRGHLEAATLV